MALKKSKKKEIVKNLKEDVKKQKTSVFVGFKGIKAKDSFCVAGNSEKRQMQD